MKHRNNHFAMGYWSLIRRGRAAPDQTDIDPKALKRLLPFVFLLDASRASIVYRLAGTTLCERHGGELRGRDFLSQWDRESRTQLPALLRQSLTESVPLCLTSVGTTEDRRMTEIETLLMPMTYNTDAPERFLGVAQVTSDISPLLDRSISFESLVTSMLVREGDAVVSEAPRANVTPLRPPKRSRTARGAHLKLVVSQAQPKPGADQQRFDGNNALAMLLARSDQDGRFPS